MMEEILQAHHLDQVVVEAQLQPDNLLLVVKLVVQEQHLQ
jgi:hypothetical protein